MSSVVGDVPSPEAGQSVEAPISVLVQKSWVQVAARSTLSKFNVEVSVVDGKAIVVVPDEVLQDTVPLWDDFLVGRFPNSAPHIAKIHVIVNKIWNLGDKSIKIDAYSVNETMVKFRIRNTSARTRVLRRGMWNICDMPMIVSKWTPIAEEAQPKIKFMPMWVILKNVPPSMFSWPGLSFLASPIGEPKRLHQETELVICFDEAKVFVDVDLTKELPKSYYFHIKGEESCVQFEYPWLPPRCETCKKWGHFEGGCIANAGKNISSPKSAGNPLWRSCPVSLSSVTGNKSQIQTNPSVVLAEATSIIEQAANNNIVMVSNSSHVDIRMNTVGNEKDTEEGEIPPVSPDKTSADTALDGEWTKITHSSGGGKYTGKTQLVIWSMAKSRSYHHLVLMHSKMLMKRTLMSRLLRMMLL